MASTGLLGINPYKRGVAIDISSKPTQMLIQLQQKEQAKNEALDKYFMDYDKNITPAGMRNIDIEGLMKRKNEAKQYYFQNKEAIKRPELDNGRAYSQFMGMNTDQLGFVSKSKEQTGKAKALSTATMNANQKKQIIADGVKDALILNELALDDPRRVDFDIANFRAYDAYDDKKFMENVWGKEELPTKIVNKDIGNGKFIPETYHLKIPEMAQLAPQRLQSAEIGTRSYVRNNEGAMKYFNTLMEDPIMLKEANKAYQEYKGPNAKIVDEEDFAVAYGLLKKPGGFIKAGKEEETAAYKRAAQDAFIRGRGNGGVDGAPRGNVLDSIGGDGTPVSLGKDKFGNQYKIEYGQVLGKDDQPFTGVSDIKGTDLPAELFSILAKSGTKLYAADNFKIRSKDGIITEIASPRGKVTRGFIENAQLTADKEPVKGQRLVYGEPVKPISASKKSGAGINWKK